MSSKKIYLLTFGLLLFLFCSCTTGYKNEDDAVYYLTWNESNGQSKRKLDANPKTFHSFNDYYAKDDQSVFYLGKKVSLVDAKTFEALSECYARDKDHIIFRDSKVIEYANVKTFEIIPKTEYYAKDHQRVYFRDRAIYGADLKTFQVVNEDECVSRDKNTFFYSEYKIPVKDPDSFKQIKGDYWKDKYHVYDISNVYNFYNDSNNAEPIILEGVDAETARSVWGRNYIKDKYGCYGRNERIDCH